MFNLRLVAQGSARSNIMYREIQKSCDGATAMWIFMLVFSPTWYRVLLYSLAGQTVSLLGQSPTLRENLR